MAFVGGPFGTPAMVKPLKFSWEEPAASIIVDKDNEDWNYQQVSSKHLVDKTEGASDQFLLFWPYGQVRGVREKNPTIIMNNF